MAELGDALAEVVQPSARVNFAEWGFAADREILDEVATPVAA